MDRNENLCFPGCSGGAEANAILASGLRNLPMRSSHNRARLLNMERCWAFQKHPRKRGILLDPPECIMQGSWFSLLFAAPDIYFLTVTVLKLLLPKWRPDEGEKRLCRAPLSHESGGEPLLSSCWGWLIVMISSLRHPELGYKLFREAFFRGRI